MINTKFPNKVLAAALAACVALMPVYSSAQIATRPGALPLGAPTGYGAAVGLGIYRTASPQWCSAIRDSLAEPGLAGGIQAPFLMDFSRPGVEALLGPVVAIMETSGKTPSPEAFLSAPADTRALSLRSSVVEAARLLKEDARLLSISAASSKTSDSDIPDVALKLRWMRDLLRPYFGQEELAGIETAYAAARGRISEERAGRIEERIGQISAALRLGGTTAALGKIEQEGPGVDVSAEPAPEPSTRGRLLPFSPPGARPDDDLTRGSRSRRIPPQDEQSARGKFDKSILSKQGQTLLAFFDSHPDIPYPVRFVTVTGKDALALAGDHGLFGREGWMDNRASVQPGIEMRVKLEEALRLAADPRVNWVTVGDPGWGYDAIRDDPDWTPPEEDVSDRRPPLPTGVMSPPVPGTAYDAGKLLFGKIRKQDMFSALAFLGIMLATPHVAWSAPAVIGAMLINEVFFQPSQDRLDDLRLSFLAIAVGSLTGALPSLLLLHTPAAAVAASVQLPLLFSALFSEASSSVHAKGFERLKAIARRFVEQTKGFFDSDNRYVTSPLTFALGLALFPLGAMLAVLSALVGIPPLLGLSLGLSGFIAAVSSVWRQGEPTWEGLRLAFEFRGRVEAGDAVGAHAALMQAEAGPFNEALSLATEGQLAAYVGGLSAAADGSLDRFAARLSARGPLLKVLNGLYAFSVNEPEGPGASAHGELAAALKRIEP